MKTRKTITSIIILLGLTYIFAACNNHCDEVSSIKSQSGSILIKLASLEAVNLKHETNKKLVSDMYQELFGNKNIEAADKYIVENYIQHNPYAADGRKALKDALKMWFKNAPKEKIDIQHIGADGDFVYIHTKMKMGNKTSSVIDIFRIEDDKIVEHWDVIQEVPEKSVNPHPMF